LFVRLRCCFSISFRPVFFFKFVVGSCLRATSVFLVVSFLIALVFFWRLFVSLIVVRFLEIFVLLAWSQSGREQGVGFFVGVIPCFLFTLARSFGQSFFLSFFSCRCCFREATPTPALLWPAFWGVLPPPFFDTCFVMNHHSCLHLVRATSVMARPCSGIYLLAPVYCGNSPPSRPLRCYVHVPKRVRIWSFDVPIVDMSINDSDNVLTAWQAWSSHFRFFSAYVVETNSTSFFFWSKSASIGYFFLLNCSKAERAFKFV